MNIGNIQGGNPAGCRSAMDFYPTPPDVTLALLRFLDLDKSVRIWEPAAGRGDMAETIRTEGYTVIATDIQSGTDYLTAPTPEGVGFIMTNPPFSLAAEFIQRSIETGLPFALLLKSQFWHAKSRYDLFMRHMPQYILPLTWRPNFTPERNPKGSPLMDVMWVVWLEIAPTMPRYLPLWRPGAEEKGGRP